MLRYLWMFLIWCLCVVLQGTFLHSIAWGVVKPDLIILWAIYIALHHRPQQGLFLGLASGLLFDFYLGRYLGIYTVVLPLIAWLSGQLQQNWYRENIPLTMLMVFILTIIGQSGIAGMTVIGGESWHLLDMGWMVLGVALYNALLTPLTYPFLHRAFTRGLLRERPKWERN